MRTDHLTHEEILGATAGLPPISPTEAMHYQLTGTQLAREVTRSEARDLPQKLAAGVALPVDWRQGEWRRGRAEAVERVQRVQYVGAPFAEVVAV